MPQSSPSSAARTSPAAVRNRGPILAALGPHLPATGFVLEIASGTGEHAVHLAAACPGLVWQPTDSDPDALTSIAAWRDAAGSVNLLPPLRLDATDPAGWPVVQADAIVAINMIHISPWAATQGLMQGASRLLAPGGILFVYGPFLEADVATAPSNLAFDQSLKRRDPAWGLRDVAAVTALASRHALVLHARIAMPANNQALVFGNAGGVPKAAALLQA